MAKPTLVKPDKKLLALWRGELAAMREADARGAEAWDRKWETVGRILDHAPPLYTLGGYKTAEEFVKKELGEDDIRLVRSYVRVARNATPDDERLYGVTRLDAALGYYESVHGPIPHGLKVNYAAMHVPVRAAGKVVTKKLADCSIAEIHDATKTHRAKKTGKAGSLHAVEDALGKALRKHAAMLDVRVHESGGRVSFAHVPNASLGVFGRIVGATKIPR